MADTYKVATVAGGCFWCIETAFVEFPGVVSVASGYAGGTIPHPSYEQVSAGTSGHVEAVQVTFDAEKTSYEKILDQFWLQIDPTDPGGQFADRGPQYQTVIFYHDEGQRLAAEKSKADLANSGKFDKPIATEIKEYVNFYPAEDYHQSYAKKNPLRYYMYKQGSGRARYLEETWKNNPQDS